MSYGDFSRKLKREFHEIDGVKTAFFLNFSDGNFREKSPTLLMIHGLNGSHFGMEFLAEKLAKNFNLILVDLPGHGETEIGNFAKNQDVKNLRNWFKKVIKIAKKIAKNSNLKIVAHSFGCYAISPEISRKYPTVFICPVPTSPKYQQLTGEIMSKIFALKFVVKIYNWTPFSALRGDLMLKNKSRKNREKQYFIAKNDAKTSQEFRVFQAEFSRAAFREKNVFENVEPRVVFFGKYDFVPKEKTRAEFEEIFAKTKIYELPSGHLPTTEQPEKLAETIRENLLK